MVQSINTKVDLVIEGTSHMGLTDYGKIMIGDKGFEFFNDRDVRKNIQIPWTEVDLVIASVMFKRALDSALRLPDEEKRNVYVFVQTAEKGLACRQEIY